MSIKSELPATIAPAAYAIRAPRTSDIICGALHRAFAMPETDVADLAALLAQIDKTCPNLPRT